MRKEECILYSGGANGAEYEFGVQAERFGIEETHFTFAGNDIARSRGVRILTPEELRNGDVSLSYVSRLMNRTYSDAPRIRKVLQTIWYQVNAGQEIYVIGKILEDGTVRGGTGWGAEFAKLCNKPIFVFDQDADRWFRWTEARAEVTLAADTAWLVVRTWVAHPDAATEPVRLRLATPCQVVLDRELRDATPVDLALLLTAPRTVQLSVEVSRAWRPADFGGVDTRELGAGLSTDFVDSRAEAVNGREPVVVTACDGTP